MVLGITMHEQMLACVNVNTAWYPNPWLKTAALEKQWKVKKKKKKRKEKSFCCGGMENKSNGKATRKIKNNVIWLKACLTSKEYKKKTPALALLFQFYRRSSTLPMILGGYFLFQKTKPAHKQAWIKLLWIHFNGASQNNIQSG